MNLTIPKELWKKTDTYFWVLLAGAGAWALLAAFVFYPSSRQSWQDKKTEYKDAQEWIAKILDVEPQRLKYQEKKGGSSDFDYTDQVDAFTKMFSIPSSGYTLNTRGVMKQAGKKSKSADMTIKSTDVETAAKFVSALLIRWPELQCDQLSLKKLSSGKNNWEVTLRFTYYF